MLRIYGVAIELAAETKAMVAEIAEHDVSQAKQFRGSMLSVVLNIAEGAGQSGGHRRQRYLTALGSARESLANLECAAALGLTRELPVRSRSKFDHIIGTLVNIVVR